MTSKILVVAPHPDDETLGCGGTVLRHIARGDAVHWVVATEMREEYGYAADDASRRRHEVQTVTAAYGFESYRTLGFRPAGLDEVAKRELIGRMGEVVRDVAPDTIYVPYRGDVHTDHAATFDAVAACTKWFRYPSVRRVLCYEALSETDFSIDPDLSGFRPNTLVDISAHIDRKLSIAALYAGEFRDHPFPRSATAIRALAQVRGVAAGCDAAEAFILLREIIGP